MGLVWSGVVSKLGLQVRDGLGMLDEHHYNYLHAGGHLLEAETSTRAKARWRCSSKYEMPGAGLVSDVQK